MRREVAVHQVHQVVGLHLAFLAQGGGRYGKGVGDTIAGMLEGQFGHRREGSYGTLDVTGVHGVGTGSKGHTLGSAIGSGTCVAAIHHIAGDSEQALGGNGIAIGAVLAQIFHEFLGQLYGNGIRLVIIVAEGDIGSFLYLVVDGQTCFIAYDADFAVLHGSDRVRHDGDACNACSARALHISVMEGHFEGFVVILVVHVVDNLQRIHIGLGQPAHHLFEAGHELLIGEVVACDGGEHGGHLMAAHFIASTVDGIEHALGQVGAGTEELHLLAYLHGAHTAGNAIVIAQLGTHEVIVFILYGTGVDAHLGTVALPVFGQSGAPQYGQVGFGRRTHVVECVEETVVGLGDHVTAVYAHATDGGSGPDGVSAEEVVVFGCAQEPHDTQFHNHLVDHLLCLLFGDEALLQVALDVDVEEGTHTSQRHGCTVLVLHGTQVAEVGPLDGFAGIGGRTGDIEAVGGTHAFKLLQGLNLLGDFLAAAHDFLGEFLYVDTLVVALLLFNQVGGAIEGDAPVVTDDAAAAVCIRKSGDDMCMACSLDVIIIGAKYAFVMRLAVFGEDGLGVLVQFVSVCLQCTFHHADAALGEDASFQGCIGLQTHNHLVVLVNISGTVCIDALREFGFSIVYALFAFGLEHFCQFVPQSGGTF